MLRGAAQMCGTFLALSVIACVTAPPVEKKPEAPAPPPIRIPPGCAADQSGEWVHSQNATFTYLARDDGGTLEFDLARAGDDAGVKIVVTRGPEGFLGNTWSEAFNASGARCPATGANA